MEDWDEEVRRLREEHGWGVRRLEMSRWNSSHRMGQTRLFLALELLEEGRTEEEEDKKEKEGNGRGALTVQLSPSRGFIVR
jgi:hypothetical protein